jgi:hypothetical protein
LEASGFGAEGYPIEVGVVFASGKRFCRLIKPHADWLHWDKEAETLHGISRSLLNRKGIDIQQVCSELNQLLADQTAYSDGWVVDYPWLIKLFDSACMNMSFKLSSLEMILNEAQMGVWHETKNSLFAVANESRHRASNDAALIQKTFVVSHQITSARPS